MELRGGSCKPQRLIPGSKWLETARLKTPYQSKRLSAIPKNVKNPKRSAEVESHPSKNEGWGTRDYFQRTSRIPSGRRRWTPPFKKRRMGQPSPGGKKKNDPPLCTFRHL